MRRIGSPPSIRLLRRTARPPCFNLRDEYARHVLGRQYAGVPLEHTREMRAVVESYGVTYGGHRVDALSQQAACLCDPDSQQVLAKRHAESCTKFPAELESCQATIPGGLTG